MYPFNVVYDSSYCKKTTLRVSVLIIRLMKSEFPGHMERSTLFRTAPWRCLHDIHWALEGAA